MTTPLLQLFFLYSSPDAAGTAIFRMSFFDVRIYQHLKGSGLTLAGLKMCKCPFFPKNRGNKEPDLCHW